MQFELNRKFKLMKALTEEEIKEVICARLRKDFNFRETGKGSGRFDITGTRKEKALGFLQTVTFKATFTFNFRQEGDAVRLQVEGSSRPIWAYWVLILFGILTIPLAGFGLGWLLAFVILYNVQKSKPKKAMEAAFEKLEFEFGEM